MLINKIPVSELYKINKKAAIRKVYRESTIPEIIPSVDSISDLYSSPSDPTDPIDLDRCPEISSAHSPFDLSCPTLSEILCLLKKGKK